MRFDKFDNGSFQTFSNPAVIQRDLQTLVGIISGIKSDCVINETELMQVQAWVNEHRAYENKQPYKEIIGIIRESLNDSVLTHDESQSIIWFCNRYIDRNGYFDSITSGIQNLTGIIKGIAIDDEINLTELEYLDNWLEENECLKNT